MLILSNNPRITKIKDEEIVFKDVNYIEILKLARDRIHEGYEILSHPLYGSIKPNETPYRTIILSSKKSDKLDLNSLSLIEQAIETTCKFMRDKSTPVWIETMLDDFQVIDLDIIQNTLNRI